MDRKRELKKKRMDIRLWIGKVDPNDYLDREMYDIADLVDIGEEKREKENGENIN